MSQFENKIFILDEIRRCTRELAIAEARAERLFDRYPNKDIAIKSIESVEKASKDLKNAKNRFLTCI